ncbi:MAG TPA: hypothetical protein VFO86_05075, partial [Terriglobia bacterium]|nr:hypothetical protein [Terriglobia bacterium]
MNKLKKTASIVVILACAAPFWTCRKNPVGPTSQAPHVTLTLAEVTTNEAWLRIAYQNGGDFVLTRDGSTVIRGHFSSGDTTVIDDGVMPQQTYTYKATVFIGVAETYTSDPLQVKTMDTTSHDFTWKTFALGDGNSSHLNDIVIVNDTLIYAVGAIFLKDSTGAFQNDPYNLATWNGEGWRITPVYFFTVCGQSALYP